MLRLEIGSTKMLLAPKLGVGCLYNPQRPTWGETPPQTNIEGPWEGCTPYGGTPTQAA